MGLSWQLPMMAATLLGILVFSLVHQPPAIGGVIYDKPFHALAYAAFSFLVAATPWRRRWQAAAWFAILTLSFLLEGAQHWLPGRTPSMVDALANVIGVAVGGPLTALVFAAAGAFRKRFR